MGFDEKIPLSLYRRVSQLWTGLAYFGKNYAASVSKISSRSFLVSLTHLAGLRGRSTSSCAGASQSSETIFRRDSHIPQGRRRLRRHRGTHVGTEECGTTLPPPLGKPCPCPPPRYGGTRFDTQIRACTRFRGEICPLPTTARRRRRRLT